VLIASLIACRQGSSVRRAIYWHQVMATDGRLMVADGDACLCLACRRGYDMPPYPDSN
jgi:hypothetical protein